MNARSARTAKKDGPSPRDEVRALYRRAILRAAEDVFAERDFHAARMNDIAAGAQLAVGTIYNHFEDKTAVLAALLEERATGLIEALAPAAGDPADYAGALTARLERALAYMALHRGFFLLSTEYGLLGGTRAAKQLFGDRRPPKADGIRRAIDRMVADGIDAGALDAEHAPLLARFLGNAIRVMSIEMRERPKTDAAFAARAAASLFLHGAGRRPEAHRKER